MIENLNEHLFRVAEYMAAGGPVIAPLAVLSVVMWTLIINRALFFRRLYRRNMPRSEAALCIVENRRPDPMRYRGAVSLLVNEFMRRRSGDPSLDVYILDETVITLVSSLERHLALIAALARVAPLLGLLGTVIGMVTTFDIIAVFGTGNTRALTGGISEALITTQIGLLVAIPGLYMSHFLARRAENLKQRISSVGMYLHRHVKG
ncbi:MAG: MotA/TolQ/ExbB proton channel family protein [Desulfobacteraceae bacterium]|jgi:biopolymer transport protein ExbB|nr:MotA/TolQ/ExbB proton channel family protein [Desulfobacteraceae bacterium]